MRIVKVELTGQRWSVEEHVGEVLAEAAVGQVVLARVEGVVVAGVGVGEAVAKDAETVR